MQNPDTPVAVSYADFPAWVREIDLAFPVTAQFVLTGNIRDIHLVPCVAEFPARMMTTPGVLVALFVDRGYDLVYSFDPVDGIALEYESDATSGDAFFPASHLGRATASTTGRLADLIRNARSSNAPRVAVLVEYASRLWAEEEHAGPDLRTLLAVAEKHADRDVPDTIIEERPGRFECGIIWLADAMQDTPPWLARAPGVRTINIPLPSLGVRKSAADIFLGSLAAAEPSALDAARVTLSDLSQGMTLREMDSAVTLAIEQGLDISRIDEAIRSYRLGVLESPWTDPLLLQRLAQGHETIGQRVLGQPLAVDKSLTVLIRSAMGLTGAQVDGASGRPQGILFFAGPTGVGKTELAKALAEILFGAEDAYIRFDMSEFAAEHTEARLIGAPPGYVGHNAGGELTNAVRERPFSILLFDEIEKAHPRILDKFLQILEDGRLTDGSGDTVYFSETVIVFTSNLGTFRTAKSDSLASEDYARWGDEYEDTAAKVRGAIERHFTEQLQRPELFSRIGDNIVVFDFISEKVGRELVAKYIAAVVRRVHARHGVKLHVAAPVAETIARHALGSLAFGGRGVSSAVETAFINPLTTALMARPLAATHLTATALTERQSTWRITLEITSPQLPQ